ncbi:MAG: methylated-DNA--[protein]-cysteine S-methyltransferase [Caulobacteraceae bacterium]|nr:methylated-DNA--[protein]-cysteine S-methyltransferase [Caulobacteraceae bacterium]
MTSTGFTLFDTSIGPCAVVWRGDRLAGVLLPERDEAALRARLARRFPSGLEAPAPAPIQAVIERIGALLDGEAVDFSEVDLDMSGLEPFQQKVYAIVRHIPAGRTITYGEIAERLGDKLLARDVGQAMGRNPYPIVVPCHRVLAAGGKLGGFSARGGAQTKQKLLAIEGYAPGGQPSLL